MGFMYKSIMEFMRKVGWVMVVVMGFYFANVNSLPFLNSQTYMKAHFLPFFKISLTMAFMYKSIIEFMRKMVT